MRWTLALVALLSASANEAAAQGKGIRLWNLTTATISEFQLSPAGKNDWGPNQTLNDKDKEVDHDERLRITGVQPGRYDAKVGYREKDNPQFRYEYLDDMIGTIGRGVLAHSLQSSNSPHTSYISQL